MATMKHGGKAEILVLVGMLLSISAGAATSENESGAEGPYSAIVERNVFNLHAPAPMVNPADLVKKTPPPNVTLTGITTILGKKVTFLTAPPTKPGSPPDSMMLAEGQAQDDIEVRSIDEKAGVVQILNHGEAQTLDFEHNGAKPSAAPAAPAVSPGLPSPAMPPPNVSLPTPNNVIRPLRSLPSRNGAAIENSGAGFNNGFGNNSVRPSSQAPAPLSPEEQTALIELQRLKYQQENNPISNILPPTRMTSEFQGAAGPPAAQ